MCIEKQTALFKSKFVKKLALERMHAPLLVHSIPTNQERVAIILRRAIKWHKEIYASMDV